MKKITLLLTLTMIVTTACSSNSWVVENNRISESPEIETYVNQLQSDKTDYKGYKVFTIAEGKKAVVISSGKEGEKLELVDVQASSKDTVITVEEALDSTEDTNPYIVVGVDEIEGAFYVYDQNGEEYVGSGYYD
jgi:ABC-type Fe3+-hydroxamate transport system substrate-binding protein